jgi:hypothetical protein
MKALEEPLAGIHEILSELAALADQDWSRVPTRTSRVLPTPVFQVGEIT